MEIYVIRHGEAVDDIEDCYGGIADFPLTERGRDQARELAASLHHVGLQAVFTSPLARAKETADLLAAQMGCEYPVVVIDELQERNSYGVLSGVNKDKAGLIFRAVLAGLKHKPGSFDETVPGAEPFNDFLRRVEGAFRAVVSRASTEQFERLAIVTHGKFTQALFERVLGTTGQVALDFTAVNVIQFQPAEVAVRAFNASSGGDDRVQSVLTPAVVGPVGGN